MAAIFPISRKLVYYCQGITVEKNSTQSMVFEVERSIIMCTAPPRSGVMIFALRPRNAMISCFVTE
jgi:hypothetical protein